MDEMSHVLIDFRTDQNFLRHGGGAITLRPINRISYHREFHPIGCTYKSMHDLAAMHPNAKIAGGDAANPAELIHSGHRGLHLNRGSNCVFVLHRVCSRTSEN